MSNVQFIQLFIILGAAQGLLLAMVIFQRSRHSIAAKLLSLSLFLFSIRLAIYPFRKISDTETWLIIANFSLLLLLLVGPAIYLFIRYKSRNKNNISVIAVLHLIPFLFYLTHLIYPRFNIWLDCSYATLTSGTIYGALSLWEIYRSSQAKMLQYSTGWLYSLAIPLLLAPVSILALVNYSQPLLGFHPATIPYLLLTIGLYRMGFHSMTNFKTFNQRFLEPVKRNKPEFDVSKLQILVQSVEKEALYLDSTISLQSLSIKTGLSRHEISESLNKGLGKSFNQFINHYRVEEVKERLVDENFKHLSIVGIALESGFSSKSAFHQIFKEFTGSTPNQFKSNCHRK